MMLPIPIGQIDLRVRMSKSVLHLLVEYKNLIHLLLVTALFFATSTAQSSEAFDVDRQSAQQLITSTSERILSALETERELIRGNRRRLLEITEEHLLPHIDFQLISRLVLGKQWRKATPKQRQQFIQEFRKFLIRFYSTSLAEYTKENDITKDIMSFLPLRENEPEQKVTVRSVVRQPGKSQSIPVNYRLYLRDNHWKIVDVVVDGVSLIVNYRSSFATEIRREGMDGLIVRLAERNAELEKQE